jgi:hypothetical protein
MGMGQIIGTRLAAALAMAWTLVGAAMAAPTASTACDPAIVDKVLHSSGASDTGQVRASACSPLGTSHRLMAVAVAYEPAGYDWKSGDNLPLYVAWYDPRAERVVASALTDIGEDAATQVDEWSLRWEPMPGLGRDAAALVVTDFVLQSAMDGDNGPTLTLFVADGPHLQAILGPTMLSYAQCSRACRDAGPSERHTRTLSLTPGSETHHGLRDLVATLHDSAKAKPTRLQLRFDGRQYVPNVDNLLTN